MDFEVKKDSSMNKTVRMPCSLIDRLDETAKKEDVSFNKLVVQCCEYALDHIKPSEPESS